MLDKDTQKYLDNFKEKEFSSYNFLCLFVGVSYIKGNKSFDRNKLLSFIEINKTIDFYTKILSDIKIKSNGIFPYSENLEEAYSKLKFLDILYTISPEVDSTIYIREDIPVNDIITLYSKYYGIMEEFVEKNIDYIKDNTKKLKKVGEK